MTSFLQKKALYWAQQQNVIPTDGLVFWASLNGNTPTVAETGQTLTWYDTGKYRFATDDGVPCVMTQGAVTPARFNVSGIPQNVHTMSCWAKVYNATENDYGQCFFGVGFNYQMRAESIGIQKTTNDFMIFGAFVGNSIDSGYAVSRPDRWNCYLFTQEGSDFFFYLNGVLVSQVPGTNYIGSSVGRIFSNYSDLKAPLEGGCLASCRIYNRVLSQPEITALAHEFHPTTEA